MMQMAGTMITKIAEKKKTAPNSFRSGNGVSEHGWSRGKVRQSAWGVEMQ